MNGYPGDTSPIVRGLNEGQLAAVQAVRGPVRIMAGAGTGKTRTIAHRIAYQIATGSFNGDQVLAVSFTERAANELRERLQRIGITQFVRTVTFHAAAWAQVRYFWKYLSDRPIPTVSLTKSRHIAPIAARYRVDARDLLSEIEWTHNLLLSDTEVLHSRRDIVVQPEQLVEARALYQQSKKRANEIDYQDMLMLCIKLLDTQAKSEIIHRYQTFTVDEFQDANYLQWQLLQKWVDNRNHVCVVGDSAQSIYGFNGGSAKYLNDFSKRYPGTKTVELTTSYRSTAQILSFAKQTLPSAITLHSARDLQGPAPAIKAATNEADEEFKITSWLKAMYQLGTPWHQMAILVRLNSQTPAWEEALLQVGIPSIVLGEGSFFQRQNVRTAITSLNQVYASIQGRKPAYDPKWGVEQRTFDTEVHELQTLFANALQWRDTDMEPLGRQAQDRHQAIAILYRRSMDHLLEGWTLAEVLVAMQQRIHMTPNDNVDAVSICTLHRSKGTEFDAIAIPACENGLIPMPESDPMEEQRLLYVGITRARKYLCLSYVQQRVHTQSGRMMNRDPSPFIIPFITNGN